MLVPILPAAAPAAALNAAEHLSHRELFAQEALAARAAAFHHDETAIVVCGQAGSLANQDHPSGVTEYLRSVAWHVGYEMDTIRRQLRRLKLSGSPHVTESRDLAAHLVIGPNGLWLHSHLAPFPFGHGTLIEAVRDSAGQWQASKVLIERATKSVFDTAAYFFALDALTRSRRKRQAILSAGPFVRQFQEVLDRAGDGKDFPIAYAMGRGITPGTEETWIMEPVNEWDPETGLRTDDDTGWVFLRADKSRESIGPTEEALFILRDWARRLDQDKNAPGHTPPPGVPSLIERHTLPSLAPWVQSLPYRVLKGFLPGHLRAIRPEEVAYVLFLIEQSQAGRRASSDRDFRGPGLSSNMKSRPLETAA